jgi:hypothetical protein
MKILHGLFGVTKLTFTITLTPILEYMHVVCWSTTAYAISVYHH